MAQLVGGKRLRKLDGLTQEILPGHLESLRIHTDHPSARVVDVELEPRLGHHASTFTRVERNNQGGVTGIPIIHVTPDPAEPDRWVRLYLHPDGRIILSTKDLYW
jgi:hypothetical protein